MTRSRNIYSAAFAAKLTPGKPYRPSNGTEGDEFQSRWCEDCTKDTDSDCEILLRAMIHDRDEPEYPKEWRIGATGQPECTAFQEIGSDIVPAIKPPPGQLSLFGDDSP